MNNKIDKYLKIATNVAAALQMLDESGINYKLTISGAAVPLEHAAKANERKTK